MTGAYDETSRAAVHRVIVGLALVATFTSLLARAQSPFPVKVAVVGFSGDMTQLALSELAVSVRGSLQRQANPQVLAIVSREEMAAVYNLRGGACPPQDVPCIIASSEIWAGRLFIRGVVKDAPGGMVVDARLESVRGFIVATALTPLLSRTDGGRELDVAMPVLVRALLDGERKYREGASGRVKHPAEANDEVAWSAPSDERAAEPARCKCLAIQSTYVPGELVVAADNLRFESSAKSATKLKWTYGWQKVLGVEATAHGTNPALTLTAKNGDALVVYFNLGSDRNNCLAHIERRRSAHR